MKPGSRDIKVNMLITGEELEELQKHTWSMVEAFGLDMRSPRNLATDSTRNRPAIPRQGGHLFQGIRPPLWERSDPGLI